MTDQEATPRVRPGFERLYGNVTDEQLLEAARRAVVRMCNGDRRWQMTVPVAWDDSDTAIMECLHRWHVDYERLLEVERAAKELPVIEDWEVHDTIALSGRLQAGIEWASWTHLKDMVAALRRLVGGDKP